VTLKRVCIFCGSSSGTRPEYTTAAEEMGRELLRRKLGLVYGGGNIGLMGVVARTVHEGGGEVIGVIPDALMRKEVGFAQLPDLRVVGSMHERKALMAELSDAFIAMPGGVGTFEEFFEIITWALLGIHAKPCGLLNTLFYYDQLLSFVQHSVDEGFLKSKYQALILQGKTAAEILDRCVAFAAPQVDKVLDVSQT